jgi:hypothetical protein
VKEVVNAVSRCVNSKNNIEFTFNGIGRLQIRDNKVKMVFYKEFLNSMDGSGKLVDALRDVSEMCHIAFHYHDIHVAVIYREKLAMFVKL